MMYSKVKALRLKQNGWHFATKNCMFECLFSEILFVFWFKMHFKWRFITVKDNWTSDNYSRNASIFSLPCLLFDQLVPCGHVNKMLWKICIIGPWSKLIHLSVHTEFQYSYVMLCYVHHCYSQWCYVTIARVTVQHCHLLLYDHYETHPFTWQAL